MVQAAVAVRVGVVVAVVAVVGVAALEPLYVVETANSFIVCFLQTTTKKACTAALLGPGPLRPLRPSGQTTLLQLPSLRWQRYASWIPPRLQKYVPTWKP